MPDARHFKALQLFTDLRRADICADFGYHALLLGRAEHIAELLFAEIFYRVRSRKSAGQGIQSQTSAVYDRLSERPEQYGAVKSFEHLASIRRVCKGYVLEHNKVGRKPVEKRRQLVNGQEHLLGAYRVRAERAQHLFRFFKLFPRADQLEGRHAYGDIRKLEIAHFISSFIYRIVLCFRR